MSDITAAPATGVSGLKLPGLGDVGAFFKRADIALAIGVLTILVVLILPLPPLLLDFALAISIILSVLILMTALFIHAPLEFSAFPTVLLIATMLRLALNLASTRLILAHGHEGTDAAGHVIEAFGNFVMSGNFVIGIIVFTILIIVNFVVITKGAGRVAEVAARFMLDAMPGKQMAIDADLSAGLIDEKEARRRREEIARQADFYGAMDGSSNVVKGDATAGRLITALNIVPGLRKVPFLLLGGGITMLGRMAAAAETKRIAVEAEATAAAQPVAPTADPMTDLLQIDPIELEVGYALIPLVDEKQGGDLLDRITLLRKQAALELGILVPPIRIRDDIRLPANEYVIKLRGSEIARAEVMPR